MEYSMYKLLIFNSLKNKVPDIHLVNVLELVSRAIEDVQLDKIINIAVMTEVSPQLNVSSDSSLINIICEIYWKMQLPVAIHPTAILTYALLRFKKTAI